MGTFITRMDARSGRGALLAVKDVIDVAGVPTTAGSRAIADDATPAECDAACLVGARTAGARIVGKANLVELAYGASGVNEWSGTPVNPIDGKRVPGGSSSGSAVAVAGGDADVAYGSDTAGSIRGPSAFCGTVGLKTTYGRIPLDGVWPLAPSLDTIGPMARDVQGAIAGMTLLEPGFVVADAPARLVGRLRIPDLAVDPLMDAAVDEALAGAGLDVVDVEVAEWTAAYRACVTLLEWEAVRANRPVLEDRARKAKLSTSTAARLDRAALISHAAARDARRFQAAWKRRCCELFRQVELVASPTVAFFAPPLTEANAHHYTALTSPVNLAGLPAVALPASARSNLPASIHLIGPPNGEPLLLTTAALIEAK